MQLRQPETAIEGHAADSTKRAVSPEEESCTGLRDQLVQMADPTRNHGINALAEGERIRTQYENQCIALGFPSVDKLLERNSKAAR